MFCEVSGRITSQIVGSFLKSAVTAVINVAMGLVRTVSMCPT